mmetsp:Transcript_17879/g.50830  ORF Transcript_17879/g.50830 Transcript_17879/m.50830 type:complete len:244 (+) Transcript_17879:373-1104(+)
MTCWASGRSRKRITLTSTKVTRRRPRSGSSALPRHTRPSATPTSGNSTTPPSLAVLAALTSALRTTSASPRPTRCSKTSSRDLRTCSKGPMTHLRHSVAGEGAGRSPARGGPRSRRSPRSLRVTTPLPRSPRSPPFSSSFSTFSPFSSFSGGSSSGDSKSVAHRNVNGKQETIVTEKWTEPDGTAKTETTRKTSDGQEYITEEAHKEHQAVAGSDKTAVAEDRGQQPHVDPFAGVFGSIFEEL